MISRRFLVVVVLSLLVFTVSAETTTRRWQLSHRILSTAAGQQEPSFVPRGEIIMTVSDNGEVSSVTIEQENGQALQITTDVDNNHVVDLDAAYYQLKLTPAAPDNDGDPVLTTVPLCHLRRANYRDIISIAISGTGHALSLSYQPMVSPLAPPTCQELHWNNEAKFDSKVELEHAVPGMKMKPVLPHYQPPPGLKILPGKRSNSGGGPTSANYLITGQDPQQQQHQQDTGMYGFFRRYWYIIVPLMLINLFGAQAPPPEEAGSSGQGAAASGAQGAAAAVAAQGAAASGVAAAASKPRRTKRG